MAASKDVRQPRRTFLYGLACIVASMTTIWIGGCRSKEEPAKPEPRKPRLPPRPGPPKR
jgi:hypothetical protein